MDLSSFKKGQRVTLIHSPFPDRIGISGIVVKIIKSRNMVQFRVDHVVPTYDIRIGQTYDAEPQNLVGGNHDHI